MPLRGQDFLSATRATGFDAFTGVPCSYLTPLLNAVLNVSRDASDATAVSHESALVRYVGATSEGEAVGIAAGMWLAGRQPVVLAQNSGLGNMVNPITSLLAPLRIPVLLVVTWRGQPGTHDEPQHALMGQLTEPLCDLLRLAPERVPDDLERLVEILERARDRASQTRASSALILPDGVIAPEALVPAVPRGPTAARAWNDGCAGPLPTRAACIAALLDAAPSDAAFVATTGKCARELYTLADGPRNLYVVGSMGCASAVALGVALHTSRRVIVLDGDGAALMKLGNLATIGATAPPNLVHVLLDNGVHDSTGGQPTAAGGAVDFAAIAAACGYRFAARATSAAGLAAALLASADDTGPAMIHVRTSPGSLPGLGRPRVAPDVVAARFREFLQ
jgi:phosphonopyruvate decarboxylase